LSLLGKPSLDNLSLSETRFFVLISTQRELRNPGTLGTASTEKSNKNSPSNFGPRSTQALADGLVTLRR
jgi:hypothetical protein